MSKVSAGLDAFFKPRGIAVIGASDGHERPGTRVLANLRMFAYTGAIYPVTPSSKELQGYKCYPSIADVPDPVDLAILCISAERTAAAIRECGKRGVAAAVVLANGFGGDLPKGQELLRELVAAHRESGIRIIGPNTVGIRKVTAPQEGVFATFAHDIEAGFTAGPVAIVTQSGGLGVYFGSSYLRRRGAGTRYVIDTGNELDVDSCEALEYVAEDPGVKCIGLIVEGCKDGRRMAAGVAKAHALGKPVVLLKVGQSAAAAEQMASHTGSLAGSAELFQGALQDAGAYVAGDEAQFVDSLNILAHGKAPRGRRMGVVTMSGGFAILAIDGAAKYGLQMPQPVVPPTAEQAPALSSGTHANPFDYQSIGGAKPDTILRSLEWMLGQPNLDCVVMWHAFGLLALESRRKSLEADLLKLMPRFKTPLFGCGITTPEFEVRMRELGVLWYEEPTRLIKALDVVAPRAEQAVPEKTAHAASAPAKVIVGAAARELLSEIDHVPTIKVGSAAEAQALARRHGRIVLKVESDRFPHKTEFGLIAGPVTAEEVPEAYERLLKARAQAGADAEPVVAQPCERGVELALGAYLDPVFGPTVMVGTGGIFLEILRDTAFAPAPVTQDQARTMITRLRGAPLLMGARGKPRCDIDAAARSVAALSRFIAGAKDAYQSVDINPLMVREEGQGAVAVDALLELRKH